MGILGVILFGLIVGALVKLVMPGRDPGGIIVTISRRGRWLRQLDPCT
jgi:uncharacterized membrane protein YeaQ/YmgE (transglycosylase-associated protein family)